MVAPPSAIHINHRGEAEACCMVPFAADNIKDKPLVDIMRSQYFSRIGRIDNDGDGVKRCLVGENTHVIEQAVSDGVAFGTTQTSQEVFLAHADEDGRLHPTCFSASIADDVRPGGKRRVRLRCSASPTAGTASRGPAIVHGVVPARQRGARRLDPAVGRLGTERGA